ncbi:tetratricopeptide repeat protein [Campylobacter estrildidarum]|uniref:Flagellar protein n=1 Tax=Campylobacter estrildidarum TaxID=2510189 RepID=A0A4U7BHH1_9BACT|nr:tetratricopeptide repeat protein [Campylobacter estrildidarum]TKX30859.1 flagellar protein [Campylobacter estrildidarum]
MRIIFLFLLSVCTLFSFELTLNTGRENNQAFAVLHVKNDLEFACQKITIEDKIHFECDIAGVVDNKLNDQSFAAFDLKFIKSPQKIKMIILPKVDARMFDSSQNIYIDKELSLSNAHKSKNFTFIFMPELIQPKNYDGINFNIDFPHESLPYIGALDLNSNPVIVPQSADINTYLRIKNDYDKGNYTQVETDASNAIKRYPSSVFMSEFILYKLRAQNQLHTQDPSVRDRKILDQMILDAKNWARTFTSDRNFFEVYYIMLRTYIALSQPSNIEYTMSILNNEPNNYFSQLAKLDYADYLYSLREREKAIDIYENTYFNTKNLDLAARAAMSLAKDFILNNRMSMALQYINTILKANPEYFGKDVSRSLELAKLFDQHKQYEISSNIYKNILNKITPIDKNYEEILKNLALSLSKTQNTNETKKYLDLYLKKYLYDGKYIDEIKKTNDEVSFYLEDNNATFLHKRYAMLMKEYSQKDENIVNKALDKDIELYYKEGNFSAVLAYKKQIEDKKLSNASKILEKAAIDILNQDLKSDNCINAVNTFMKFKSYEIGQKIEGKKQMLNCFVRTSKLEQAIEYADKNYNEDPIFYGLQKASMLYDNKQYGQVLKIAKDIANSRILKSDEENFKAYYLQFLSYLKINEYNKAIKILKILESFPMNFTMIEAYDTLVSYADDHKMQTTILTYAPKAIDYQNLKGINLYSPNLEFIYLDALAKTNQNEKSLDILVDLLKLKLSDEDRARALYMQSLTYEKMKNIQAQKESLEQCLKLKPSSWQNLCRDKNQMIK